jgi:integrase
VSDATRPEVPRVVVEPPEVDDVRGLLALAHETDPELGCWLDVAAATGARRAEICSLRWSDIDLDRQTVRIERSVSATKEHGVFIKTTRTDRFRLVPLADQATRSLVSHRLRVGLNSSPPASTSAPSPTDSATPAPQQPSTSTGRGHPARDRQAADHLQRILTPPATQPADAFESHAIP